MESSGNPSLPRIFSLPSLLSLATLAPFTSSWFWVYVWVDSWVPIPSEGYSLSLPLSIELPSSSVLPCQHSLLDSPSIGARRSEPLDEKYTNPYFSQRKSHRRSYFLDIAWASIRLRFIFLFPLCFWMEIVFSFVLLMLGFSSHDLSADRIGSQPGRFFIF